LATEINFEAAALSISASSVGHGGMQYRISGRRSAWFFLYAEKIGKLLSFWRIGRCCQRAVATLGWLSMYITFAKT